VGNDPGPDHADDDAFRISAAEELVGDIDLDPFLKPRHDPLAGPLDSPIEIDTSGPPLLVLRDLLCDERFPEKFSRALRSVDPDFREMFPRDPGPVLREFVRAMSWALETTEEARGDQAKVEEVVDFARHLGADHRKLELQPQHHQHFGEALAHTLRHLAGRGWDDTRLLSIAAAFEATGSRRAEPPRTPRLG